MRQILIKQCLHCNRDFEIEPYVLKRGRGKFCSRGCTNHYFVGKRLSPNTEFKYKNGSGYRHRLIKKDSRCLLCNATGYLEVDHIDKDRTNNNPSNLRILCHPCHTKRHQQTTWDRAGNSCCLVCGDTSRKPAKVGMCYLCYKRKYQPIWRSQRKVAS